MEKRYNLPVAIAMVIGTVIGSGIFFKAEAVLKGTGGNMGMVFATFYAYGTTVLFYLIVSAVMMFIGVFFKGKKKA